jgi:hypothetical protein
MQDARTSALFVRFLPSSHRLVALFLTLFAAKALWSQSSSSVVDAKPEIEDAKFINQKRIFGIIPNYRTAPYPNPYVPIPAREKFKLASQDSFDRGTVVLAAAFAGEAQLTNANRSFGQGAAGYGRYLGTSYADFVIGDYMTEAIYPSVLHQDPRYFRKGQGGVGSRLWYAVGQIVITHGDNGRTQLNASELLGNATAVAVSNAYYADNRDASDASIKWATQLSVDAAANILKEFSPDILRKFSRKH